MLVAVLRVWLLGLGVPLLRALLDAASLVEPLDAFLLRAISVIAALFNPGVLSVVLLGAVLLGPASFDAVLLSPALFDPALLSPPFTCPPAAALSASTGAGFAALVSLFPFLEKLA
jgi:hypothetical protein